MKSHELEALHARVDSKRERQRAREAQQIDDAILHYKDRRDAQIKQDKGEATGGGQRLVDSITEALIPRIELEVLTHSTARRKRGWCALLVNENVDSTALAYLTASQAITASMSGLGLTKCAEMVGVRVCHHINMERYKAHDSKNQTYAVRDARQTNNDFAAANLMKGRARRAGVNVLEWSDTDCQKVGFWALGMAVEESPYVNIVTEPVKRIEAGGISWNTRKVIRLSPEGEEAIEDYESALFETIFSFRPMTCQPDDWTSFNEGGYLRDRRLGVVRKASGDLKRTLTADWPEIPMEAVNVTQSVAHAVNGPVYEVMKQCYEIEHPVIKDIKLPDHLGDAPVLADYAAASDDEKQAKQDFDNDLKVYKSEKKEAISRRDAIEKALGAAEQELAEPELYYVHSMDRRQRIYPMGNGLSPQGSKYEKALIMAAHGKPIGDDNGPAWLAVHIANLYGYDKVSFEDRLNWTLDNEDAICRDIANPLRDDALWVDADSPFEFLGAVFAWGGYLVQGADYQCHIAVARDGSNSGLQHYSALLRDPLGAGLVNVTPSELPADVYTLVMDEVKQTVADWDKADDKYYLADMWNTPDEDGNHRITRNICKQPVMTYYYSARQGGMADQMSEHMPKSWLPVRTKEDRSLRGSMAHYLAGVVRQAVADLVPAAATAMSYMQQLISIVLDEDREMRWQTPLDFPVYHKYYGTDWSQQHRVWQGSEGIKMKVPKDDPTVPLRTKNRDAISPNFIHSLDSTHLLMCILGLKESGVEYVRAVHDSISVLPSDVDELDQVIRETFVELYDDTDWLEDLEIQVRAMLADKPNALTRIDMLRRMRTQGDLDIREVESSDFFFS